MREGPEASRGDERRRLRLSWRTSARDGINDFLGSSWRAREAREAVFSRLGINGGSIVLTFGLGCLGFCRVPLGFPGTGIWMNRTGKWLFINGFLGSSFEIRGRLAREGGRGALVGTGRGRLAGAFVWLGDWLFGMRHSPGEIVGHDTG